MTGKTPPPGDEDGDGCGDDDVGVVAAGVGEALPGGSDPAAVGEGIATWLGLGLGPVGGKTGADGLTPGVAAAVAVEVGAVVETDG